MGREKRYSYSSYCARMARLEVPLADGRVLYKTGWLFFFFFGGFCVLCSGDIYRRSPRS